jgi:hypothetical protein
MDWQLVLTGAVVLAAALYLGRRTWRTWTARDCGGCGCGKKSAPAAQGQSALISSESLTLRARPRS